MKLTKNQYIRAGIALLGITMLVGKQYLDTGTFDISIIMHSTNFGDLLEAVGLGAIFSQYIPRKGDTSEKHVEAKVDAKVAEILRTTVPPSSGAHE